MQQQEIIKIFDYLKRLLFENGVPMMESDGMSQESAKLVQGMNLLNKWLSENKEFAENIATGQLNCEAPAKDNPICDSLKMLRSNLSHLVWQARQVAEGDYNQKVVMLGEFSDGFNSMIEQLSQREEALVEQNYYIKEKAIALLESNELLSCITENMKDYIIVFDVETKESVFENKALHDWQQSCPAVASLVKQAVQSYKASDTRRFWEITIPTEEEENMHFYAVNSFFIDWQGKKATAHLVADITEQKQRESSIAYIANSDDLTGLYNRRFCMEILEEYIAEKIPFSVCYIDLDGLKFVNDKYGHSYGDDYIQKVSDVFTEVFRSSDTICRIGGDEFVIILKKCPPTLGELRMGQAYEQIVAMSMEEDNGYPMSISYGIYSCTKDNVLSAEQILEQADGKMYAFKMANKKERI